MTQPRFLVAPQPNDHVWVFGRGAFGPARWLVPVKVWEINGAGQATPCCAVELKNPLYTDDPGFDYAVPVGDYFLFNGKLYDGIGDAFTEWLKTQGGSS